MTGLVGRTTPGIQRVGDTVRRPTGAHSAFVHRLLQHLEAAGFAGSPRFLGEEAGIEILSFIPGDVPPDLGRFDNGQLSAAAQLLREFHDVTTGFEGRGAQEVVCHGDASPCNCVFRDGWPIAFIDFDTAHAGTRREDVGYAAWLWLDIGDPDQDPVEQGQRLAGFVDAYGALDQRDAIPAVLDAQRELAHRSGAPPATQEWAAGCLRWSTVHRAALEAGLASERRYTATHSEHP
jgi:hypothetical protein